MKFIVSSSLLYKELQNIGGIINTTNTIPILDNFLFNIDKNKLKITSSDLESSMTSEIEVESESDESIAVSAKLLLDILKTFADQPLTFNKTDKNTSNQKLRPRIANIIMMIYNEGTPDQISINL